MMGGSMSVMEEQWDSVKRILGEGLVKKCLNSLSIVRKRAAGGPQRSRGPLHSLCSFIDGRPLPVCALLFQTPTVLSTPPSYVPTVTLTTFTIPGARTHILYFVLLLH